LVRAFEYPEVLLGPRSVGAVDRGCGARGTGVWMEGRVEGVAGAGAGRVEGVGAGRVEGAAGRAGRVSGRVAGRSTTVAPGVPGRVAGRVSGRAVGFHCPFGSSVSHFPPPPGAGRTRLPFLSTSTSLGRPAGRVAGRVTACPGTRAGRAEGRA
jgi:hypothetical protein